jgi:hypothetical protein
VALSANACEFIARRAVLKRATIFFLGFFLLCLPSLDAQTGMKPLTFQDIIHPENVVAPGISTLSWRPGGKPLTYVRPTPGGRGNDSTLCAYNLESHAETVLYPSARKEPLNLNSYQWSPRGDAILLRGE